MTTIDFALSLAKLDPHQEIDKSLFRSNLEAARVVAPVGETAIDWLAEVEIWDREDLLDALRDAVKELTATLGDDRVSPADRVEAARSLLFTLADA